MTERRLKKMLLERPNLISDDFVRTASESKRYVAASRLTPELLVQRVRLRLDLPDEVWEHTEQTLANIRRRDKKRLWFGTQRSKAATAFQVRRRLAIASILILLMLAFFTLVPTGRAVARSAFDYVMTVFSSRIEFKEGMIPSRRFTIPFFVASSNDREKVPNYSNDEVRKTIYKSIDDFIEETNMKAVRLEVPDYKCEGTEAIYSDIKGLSIKTKYSSNKGEIVITQKWMDGEDVLIESQDAFKNHIIILDNVALMYTIDSTDGVFDGIAMLTDSILWISATDGVDIQCVLSFLFR